MMKLFGQRKKKSIGERKLELISQIKQLNTGLENVKQQDLSKLPKQAVNYALSSEDS